MPVLFLFASLTLFYRMTLCCRRCWRPRESFSDFCPRHTPRPRDHDGCCE